jgi:hypothetical protein
LRGWLVVPWQGSAIASLLINVPTTSLTSVGFYAITIWPSLPGTPGKGYPFVRAPAMLE